MAVRSIHQEYNMRTKLSLTKLSAAAALLCAAAAAQADITVYTNQADFLAAVSAPGVDTFDDLTLANLGDSLNRSAGAYTYNVYSGTGLYGAGGDGGDYWLSNNQLTNPIVFSNFGSGVSAFGGNFFGSDVFGQYVLGNVILTAIDGSVVTYNLDNATTTDFLGFVSTTPLSAVTLGAGVGGYWPTANNVVLAVPEPATYGMLLAGLGFVGLMSRRRR
jgi:hypothetical protein